MSIAAFLTKAPVEGLDECVVSWIVPTTEIEFYAFQYRARQSRLLGIDRVIRDVKCGRIAIRGYLAALSYADTMAGRVLDALENGPYSDNMTVVLCSDNGDHLGEKGGCEAHFMGTTQ